MLLEPLVTYQVTNNAELMYDTRAPPQNRPRVILGDGSIKKVDFEKVDITFHSHIKYPATLYSVRFVLGLVFNIFSYYAVQEHHEIGSNRSGGSPKGR